MTVLTGLEAMRLIVDQLGYILKIGVDQLGYNKEEEMGEHITGLDFIDTPLFRAS